MIVQYHPLDGHFVLDFRTFRFGDYTVPEKMLDFCEKNKIDLAPGGLQVTDDGIMHALRPKKKARGAAISEEQMHNMAEIIEKAEIYYDSAEDKKNFVFVAEDKGEVIKYVFNPNYASKADGKKERRNLFVTAGIIQERNILDDTKKNDNPLIKIK